MKLLLNICFSKRIRATYEHIYKQMFIKGEGSDITVIALNREWRLHRVYLKHSPFFSALLEGGWKESNYEVLKLNLIDKNITEEGLHVTFGSFYSDDVQITKNVSLLIFSLSCSECDWCFSSSDLVSTR